MGPGFTGGFHQDPSYKHIWKMVGVTSGIYSCSFALHGTYTWSPWEDHFPHQRGLFETIVETQNTGNTKFPVS